MNLAEIRQECWDLAREVATVDRDRLWTTAEMNSYINRIYRYIARETKCIRDSMTANDSNGVGLCRIASAPPANLADLTALAANDAYAAQDLVWYNSNDSWLNSQLVAPYSFPLSPLVLDIDEVKWTTRQWKLRTSSVVKWRINPWWEQVLGMPTEYATDGDNNRLFVNFRDNTSDTLKLTVRRLPLTDLVNDTDTPEFRTHYHDYFINGVLWRMYSKQDTQTFDATKAEEYRQAFLRDVDEIKQQEVIINQKLHPNNSLDAFR